MNSYLTLIETLKRIFEDDERVSTVVTGDSSETDMYKRNIFPLVHITLIDSPFISKDTTAVTRYNIEVTVVTIRDINKEHVIDKFWHNDNRHENWNLTRSILKTAEIKLIKDKFKTDVTLESAGGANPMSFEKENLLDGWQQQWSIDVPDLFVSQC